MAGLVRSASLELKSPPNLAIRGADGTPNGSYLRGFLNGGPYWNRVEPHLAVAGSGGIAAPAGGDAGVSRGLGQRIDW